MEENHEVEQQMIADYKATFNTDTGQAVLRDLKRQCGLGGNPYVEGSFDRTSQKCGKLAIGLYIVSRLAANSEPRQQTTENKTDERTPLWHS